MESPYVWRTPTTQEDHHRSFALALPFETLFLPVHSFSIHSSQFHHQLLLTPTILRMLHAPITLYACNSLYYLEPLHLDNVRLFTPILVLSPEFPFPLYRSLLDMSTGCP